ncbi:hypothetical protein DDIC_13075 [Desulfovibrio desulfuricans]|uniref:Uncharacterized protein n=1 Tax=Desulfovibrio desulfuricans TaxID=876 RepID=A0A4P7UJW9_DESDE|nr:hypothetical protein [Desulfovibrio desulfuricans]QCC86795.1 hypothetical protein DDIC_13075 [Desulfovibrio desulfuricans]
MSIPFLTRKPNSRELERLRLSMSVFRDGSGQERESDNSSRPGWRDFERIFADILAGYANENKEIFDVVVSSTAHINNTYGISLKSKELSRASALEDLENAGRVYMELCNSPAKLWEPIVQKLQLTENVFREKRQSVAKSVGECIIATVTQWHTEAKQKYENNNPGKKLDIASSKYITVSSKIKDGVRSYQVHSFSLSLPTGLIWEFSSEKCLRGYDSSNPREVVFDWYGLSGGQLKYYPRASEAIYKSPIFYLEQPPVYTPSDRAKTYWPAKWGSD